MGLDLYIEARIRERKTQSIVSVTSDAFADDDDRGFVEICRWCSWMFSDIRAGMIGICNKYAGTGYTDADFAIPIPQEALREIYVYLVRRSVLPADGLPFALTENNPPEWEKRDSYEKMNLVNAEKLHDLLWVLDNIQYYNDAACAEKYIADPKVR